MGYPDKEAGKLFSDGFQFGFNLCYAWSRQHTVCRNLISVSEHAVESKDKIYTEIGLGRISGPFLHLPL